MDISKLTKLKILSALKEFIQHPHHMDVYQTMVVYCVTMRIVMLGAGAARSTSQHALVIQR